jgi:hypothetical protein
MAFESKRLRVQLPCKKAGTLVEKEADVEAAGIPNPECTIYASCRFDSPIGCQPFLSPRTCAFGTPECFGFRTPFCRNFDSPGCYPYQTEVGCGRTEIACRGFVTFDCGPVTDGCLAVTRGCGPGTWRDPFTELIVVEPDPEDPGTVLLRPEDLARFRSQLQAELEQIEALEQRKGEVEGQLKELDSAEKALKKRSKRK